MLETTLTSEQLKRYHRHLLLPEIGIAGQEKLLQSKVLIVGLGGLGCPAALYLTAAGVGHIGLIDFDRVEASNLQRQVLYTLDDVGQSKVEAAKKRLQQLNPELSFACYPERLTAANALKLFEQYDYIIDGSDNFTTRYLVNDACVLTNRVNIYGAIFRFEGQASVLAHPEGPCYRCLFPTPPELGDIPNCAEAGVLGVLPGLIGSLQACETIKLILKKGRPLIGRLQLFNALEMSWQEMKLMKNSQCPVCGEDPTIDKLEEQAITCSATQTIHPDIQNLAPTKINELLSQNRETYVLLDVRTELEYTMGHIDGALLMPLDSIDSNIAQLEPHKNKTIIVNCQAGKRSLKALNILQRQGFKQLINMDGGFKRWEQTFTPS